MACCLPVSADCIVDIALSKSVTRAELESVLRELLQVADVRVLNPDEAAESASPQVAVYLSANASEFSCGLDVGVVLAAGCNPQYWLIGLARALSLTFNCQVICDGSGFGDDGSPYWSIVWDRGVPFLADDAGSTIGDGEGGPVRIARRLADELFVDPSLFDPALRRPAG